MPLADGQVFAGYTILRVLGAGGMGEVFLAHHPRLPRRDALKVLGPAVSSDEEFRQRFNLEAEMASTLNHPNIVTIYDRGDFEGQLWIAMEFVDGTDAAHLLADLYPHGIPAAELVDIVAGVAAALDYAHSRGVLHRDIKPANILIGSPDSGEKRVMLADFGVARWIGKENNLTGVDMTVGTVTYAAPEQLMGDEIDGHADQYALAATAYRLLTGQTPYQDTNQIAVISQHLSAPPPKASDLKPWLEPLNEVLIKAMGKSPEDRFDSCTKFARAFERQAELVTESPTLNLRTAELKLPTVTPVVTPEPAAEPPSAPEVTPPPVAPPPVVSAEPVPEPEPAPGPEPEPEPVAPEPVAPPPAPEPPVPPVPPVSPPSVDPVSEPTPPPVPQRGPVGPPPDPKPFRPEPDSSPSAPPYRQPVPGPPPIPPQRPVRPTHETVSPTVVLPVIPADPAAHAAPGVGRPTAPPPPSYSQLAADIGKTPPGRGQSSGGKTKIWVIGGAIAAVIVVLIGVVLLNSGDDSSGPSDASGTSTQSSGANTPSSSHKPAPPVLVGTPGNYQTIATYLKSNNIQESLVHRNEPGAPVVTMPMPPGWADAGPQTPAFAYQSIVYNGPSAGNYRPSATALISRLGPNADAQKILDFAPGELNNLPGFTPTDTGTPGTVDGHKSFQIAGSWNSNGVTKLITQNTVVIQDGTGLYVMQINIDGVADQAEIIKQITEAIDRDTKIAAG